MTIDMDTSSNLNLVYLLDQIRTNLSPSDGNEAKIENPRAHAWLLTTLSIYGDQLNILIELYRLFREKSSYKLLSFIIEHILQHHLNEIDKSNYLQDEFQLIFKSSTSKTPIEKDEFSYFQLYSILSPSIRDNISSILIRKWYEDLEKSLLASIKSMELLNQVREKALVCLSLSSSSSISSILQLIINTEDKIGFNTKQTSLNIIRCLFVQDLLPIVLENRQRLNIQPHLCHKWLIYAIEFYLEYLIKCFKNNQITTLPIKLEGSYDKTYQCDNPIEQIEKLMNLAMGVQENFNWQQFIIQNGNQKVSSNRRQKLLELRILIDRAQTSSIRCPLECFIFCTSFPTYIQSVVNLSSILNNEVHKDYIFICSTSSIKTLINKQNETNNFELIENFYLFVECLNLLQESQTSSCLKLYQETIDKIHFNSNIENYLRILKIFYFYYHMEKSKIEKSNKTIEKTSQNTTIIIDDTPQSPTMQDDSNVELNSIVNNSPLTVVNIEKLIHELNDNTLESRLQVCSLLSIANSSDQRRSTLSSCIDTLIYLHDNYSSHKQQKNVLPMSSDYCFIPCSYNIIFDYLLDIILENISPSLILLQIEQERSSLTSVYPKSLLSTVTPTLLYYIYDQKLLGQLLKYIQTTTTKERSWIINPNYNSNKRKLDHEDNKLTDDEFIEKIIQHFSNITQWSDDQRRQTIYTYLIEQRHSLV